VRKTRGDHLRAVIVQIVARQYRKTFEGSTQCPAAVDLVRPNTLAPKRGFLRRRAHQFSQKLQLMTLDFFGRSPLAGFEAELGLV
jgi:hypothetical protein